MARSMWKGVISFGLVSIPVRLYVATESHSVSFRQLCGEHLSPIKYKRWCQAGDHEVAFTEIVKGYEVSADNYVVIEDSDLENLPLPTTHSIEISEFVPENHIEGGLYFKSAYYMEPEETGRKAYQLLKEALADTGMVAIAKVEGQQVVSAPEVGPEPRVMDLMEALRASVDAAKKQRASREPAKTR